MLHVPWRLAMNAVDHVAQVPVLADLGACIGSLASAMARSTTAPSSTEAVHQTAQMPHSCSRMAGSGARLVRPQSLRPVRHRRRVWLAWRPVLGAPGCELAICAGLGAGIIM